MKKFVAVFLTTLLVTTALFAGGAKESNSSTQNTKPVDMIEKETVNLKVWGSIDAQDLLKEMVESFKQEYPEKEYNIEFGIVSEADAKARYLEDPEAAADVFFFANDQLKDMVKAGALYQIAGSYKEKVIAQNGEGSVESATVDNKLYAFPETADNGYFMYYDKSVISSEDAKSLDSILAACKESNKKFYFDLSNSWYVASFFFGAGCSLGIDENGKQTCNFNNADGLSAANAIKELTASPYFMGGDQSVLTGGMGDSLAAGVCGTWVANAMKEKLGDNYAATKLPTFTRDGEQVQLGSFAGYKLCGVSKVTKSPVDAMKLAQWFTNEQNQLLRFEKRGIGPSNIKVAAMDEVLKTPELAALAQQSLYAVSQNDVLGTFWGPVEAFGANMEAFNYEPSIQAQLDDVVSQITN